MISIGHLDLNIVTHCNMRCAGCSHASPFSKAWFMSEETIQIDLLTLKPILTPRTVHIVGGEPLLHPKLTAILKLVHGMGFRTSIITNGKLLPRMPDEFWKSLEYLQLSVYAPLDRGVVRLAEEKSKALGFGLGVTEFTEFYKQLIPMSDGSSFHNCPWKTDCYTVHDGFFYLCPQSTFFPSRFMGLAATVDGLPLDGITEKKLREFMDRKQPFNACKICRGYGEKMPWKESKTAAEWLKDSQV